MGNGWETDGTVRLFRNSGCCIALFRHCLHPPHCSMAGDRDPLLLDWMQGWAMSLLEENYNAANISQRITDQESPTQS